MQLSLAEMHTKQVLLQEDERLQAEPLIRQEAFDPTAEERQFIEETAKYPYGEV